MSPKHFLLYFLQVAVFAGGVDTNATETKGTVLIHSAEQVSFFFFITNMVSCIFNICFFGF